MTAADTPPRILIYESVDPIDDLAAQFAAHGIEVRTLENHAQTHGPRRAIPAEELIAGALDVDAVMGLSGARITREVLQALPRLRYISKLGIGYDVVDIDAATELGVLVTNTPVHEEIVAVAEHTVALILACAKRLDFYSRRRMQHTWHPDKRVYAQTLDGKTVGIIGYGRIGRAVAQRLQGWNVRLLAHDRAAPEPAWGAQATTLEHLMRESDIVTVHASAELGRTRPLLDKQHLALLKRGSVLVNTARGALIDQVALTDMLATDHLAAAGLDVFHPQPPDPADPLFDRHNLFATPHSAAWVPEVSSAIQRMGTDNAVAMLQGRHPESIVNPDALGNSARWSADAR